MRAVASIAERFDLPYLNPLPRRRRLPAIMLAT
jgi:hypothetical protein